MLVVKTDLPYHTSKCDWTRGENNQSLAIDMLIAKLAVQRSCVECRRQKATVNKFEKLAIQIL